MQTFTNSEDVLNYLQRRFGSANYRSWQTIRKQFYSFVTYPEAGASVFNFFGTALGATNRQLTNIPKQNSLGQNHFLVKSIRTMWLIDNTLLSSYAATDATTLYSDIVNGLFQAGVLNFSINARIFSQIPRPFLYAPPGGGQSEVYSACLQALVLVEGTPNTFSTASCNLPYAKLEDRHENCYLVDPNILIEAEQSFEVSINYPSPAGLVPVIATGITDDTSNPLKIGVSLDGVLFRPVQ